MKLDLLEMREWGVLFAYAGFDVTLLTNLVIFFKHDGLNGFFFFYDLQVEIFYERFKSHHQQNQNFGNQDYSRETKKKTYEIVRGINEQ